MNENESSIMAKMAIMAASALSAGSEMQWRKYQRISGGMYHGEYHGENNGNEENSISISKSWHHAA
jgi:hypothetical protein